MSKRTRKPKPQARKGAGGRSMTGGFHVTHDRTLAGQEDVEYTTHRYETTSAFTATGGAASYLLHKGNSVYRPYSGNTDSVGGYARMYTQYRKSLVVGSRIEVKLWCATTGVQEPFRIAVFPCSVAQSTIYTAYTNIAQLRDVPHCKEVLFSPGSKMPTIRAEATTAQVLDGVRRNLEDAESAIGKWEGTTGADPTTLWYFGVGYQNMAGTTTNNLQAQVMIEYKVKWYEPVATAVQVERNRFGNEYAPSALELAGARAERKLCELTKFSETKTPDGEQKGAVGYPALASSAGRSPEKGTAMCGSAIRDPVDGWLLDPDEERLFVKFLQFVREKPASAKPEEKTS